MSVPKYSSLCSRDRQIFYHQAQDVDASGPWLFWSQEAAPALQISLEHQGQLQPVLVDASSSCPVLVAGAARLQVLASLNQEVLCLDVGAQSPWDKGLIYLASNSHQSLDDASLIQALRFFQHIDAHQLETIFPLLGIDSRSQRAQLARSWLALPLTWDEFLFAGRVPLACAPLLQGMEDHDLHALYPLFTTLSWSRSAGVKLLTWIKEIMMREAKSVGQILEVTRVYEILEAQLSPKDRIAKISALIWAYRYPHWSALEEKFNQAVQSMTARSPWQVLQTDLFETSFVDLKIRINNQEDLHRAVHQLAALVSHDAWELIFKEED